MSHASEPRIGITGIGTCLPAQVMTSAALFDRIGRASGLSLPLGTFARATGIATRRVSRDDEYASTLAIAAAEEALAGAGVDPLELDLLLFASASRDMAEPATAHVVQAALGSRAHCLDVTNACNSFLNGIDVARSLMLTGRASRALVVTGETPTRSMRWQVDDLAQVWDGFAGYTFGDAGAAVVLQPVASGGIVDVDTETDSTHWGIGGVPGGGSRHPRSIEHTYFTGDGQALRGVFEKLGTGILDRVRDRTGYELTDYARILVHQVTLPYLDRFVEVTGVPRDRLEVTVTDLGNIASATLGVQLARVDPALASGDRVLLVGLGGGISVMTMVWEVVTDLWVVIPALNEAERIGDTLTALAVQTDRDFTLLVVDNGSGDDTVDLVNRFAAAAPFAVRVIVEPEKGTGSAVDTGFRTAIAHGARLIARTDADCLPHPGWVAAARAALDGGAGMVCGRIRARRDEHGPLGRAGFRTVVTLAATFGRLRPAHRRGFRAPYRMHAGNNMAITAELYQAVGGMPRRPSPTDRTFLNRVRRHTAAIARSRAMVVENSTRRLSAYGLVGAARWYLDRGSAGLNPDPR